jgi:hypothetical protein
MTAAELPILNAAIAKAAERYREAEMESFRAIHLPEEAEAAQRKLDVLLTQRSVIIEGHQHEIEEEL